MTLTKRSLQVAAILAGAVLFYLLGAMLLAHAAHADPVGATTAAVDTGWQVFTTDGPLWGALLVANAILRTFVSRQHWIAQGKVLSGLTGVSMVLAAVLAWHFAGAPASGILTALFAGYALITHSTVPGAGKESSGPPTSTGAAALLVVLLGGLAVSQSACAASTRESTLKAAMVTVDASRGAYVAYDEHAQAELVAHATSLEEGKAKLAEYRAKRNKAVLAMTVAYQAIATAAQLTDDRSLASVAAAIGEVIATVKTLTGGVQ